MTRIKICGLTRAADVELAVDLGAHAIGVVLDPSSPRCVADAASVRSLLEVAGTYVVRVAVFGRAADRPDLGLFDRVQAWEFNDLDLPADRRIAVCRVGEPGWEDRLATSDPLAWVLLDRFSESAAGGTGEAILAGLLETAFRLRNQRTGLAGGLSPETVGDLVRRFRPAFVDVSSGVESGPGVKDPGKLRSFFEAVRGASGA